MDRIVLFLNGTRGIAVAKALLGAGHGIVAAVVPEERRGAEPCRAHGLDVIAVPDVNDPDFVRRVAAFAPDLLVIAGFPQIFLGPLRSIGRHGAINLHAGRVPAYRGGSPLNWQIINGETSAGISILAVDEGIDSGDVLAEQEIPIGPMDTIADLHRRVDAAFPSLVLRVVKALEHGKIERRKQDPACAFYWHQRAPEDGRIFWDRATARQVHNLVRALTRPYPGAFCYWGPRRVTILAATVPEGVIRGAPGRVCHIQGRGPYVVCADRALLLGTFEVEGAAQARLPAGVHLTSWPVAAA